MVREELEAGRGILEREERRLDGKISNTEKEGGRGGGDTGRRRTKRGKKKRKRNREKGEKR